MWMERSENSRDWTIRLFVYRFFAERERMPTTGEIAGACGLEQAQAREALQRLHQRHALFRDPASGAIRMAHPFSGIPTAFSVYTRGHRYWANCAWDALGIPAMLHADARIEAGCPDSTEPVTLVVEGDHARENGEIIHFPLPFQHWYDDLIHT